MTTKTDPAKIRQMSLRITAKRRGLNLMKRGDNYWIINGHSGEIVAGGAQGLLIDEAEHLIRSEGLGKTVAA